MNAPQRPSHEDAIETIVEGLRASEARVAELEARLAERSPETRELRENLAAMEARIAQLELERDHLRHELEHSREVIRDERRTANYLRRKLRVAEGGPEQTTRKELNFWRGRVDALESELAPLREREQRIAQLEASCAEALAARTAAETQLRASEREQREQESRLCGLDADLQSRKAELERIETQLRRADEAAARLLTDKETLEERVALAEQRNEDQALEIEQLTLRARRADRRRTLIGRLIGELRQRQRANLALKSALDALRTHKHKVAMEQQKLLEKYRRLQARLAELENGEVVEDYVNTGMVHAMANPAPIDDSTLEQRLRAQAVLIETLERDLDRLQKLRREVDQRDRELAARDQRISELCERLERRQELIDELTRDLESTRRGRRDAPASTDATASRPVGDAVSQALAAMDTARTQRQDTGTIRLRALPASAEGDGAPQDSGEDASAQQATRD